MKILQGIKVIDFTHLLPGPLATQMLVEMGAQVIKIERPNRKDRLRYFPPMNGETSYVFEQINKDKQIRSIDYTTDNGRKQAMELIREADIVLEQFRPGAMSAWKLGYEDIQSVQPEIIYASITGYSQTGPYASHAGHDLNYLAYSGILSLITDQKGHPVIPGVQFADILGGTYPALISIMTALYHRERTGKGQYIDIALLQHIMPSLTIPYVQKQSSEGSEDTSFLSGELVNYNVYQCADDQWMALGALELKFWNAFCDSVERAAWKRDSIDLLYTDVFLYDEVMQLFKSKTRAEWTEHAQKGDFCLSPVLSLDEISADPHFINKGWADQLFSMDI